MFKSVYTDNKFTSIYTTNMFTSVYTTSMFQSVYTDSMFTSIYTTNMFTSVYTTNMFTSVYTDNMFTSVYTTNMFCFDLYSTDRMSAEPRSCTLIFCDLYLALSLLFLELLGAAAYGIIWCIFFKKDKGNDAGLTPDVTVNPETPSLRGLI
ncbi:hypothetical protein BsWGS_16905 [Bradybaena similaris]